MYNYFGVGLKPSVAVLEEDAHPPLAPVLYPPPYIFFKICTIYLLDQNYFSSLEYSRNVLRLPPRAGGAAKNLRATFIDAKSRKNVLLLNCEELQV